MDATTASGGAIWTPPGVPYCPTPEHPETSFALHKRICYNDYIQGEFPLSANPSIVLHVLSACSLDPEDLARLEASNHTD